MDPLPPFGSCKILHTTWEPRGLRHYFSGVFVDLENFCSNLLQPACLPACLPALAWRTLSGCVSSRVYSASQTNELRSWAGFQACKGQKTIIHKSQATTCQALPLSPALPAQLNLHGLPTSGSGSPWPDCAHTATCFLTTQRKEWASPGVITDVGLNCLIKQCSGKDIWID